MSNSLYESWYLDRSWALFLINLHESWTQFSFSRPSNSRSLTKDSHLTIYSSRFMIKVSFFTPPIIPSRWSSKSSLSLWAPLTNFPIPKYIQELSFLSSGPGTRFTEGWISQLCYPSRCLHQALNQAIALIQKANQQINSSPTPSSRLLRGEVGGVRAASPSFTHR